MRLVPDRRARRLLRALPRGGPSMWVEFALLGLLAWQAARLVWAIVTPVDPLGAWRGDRSFAAAPAGGPIAGNFDPFFRLAAANGGPAVVTGLDLKLFGIRADQASGRGSAIIGTPDGLQQSYGVGETILPGVTLAAVAFDHVSIQRGAAREELFLDQSKPVASVAQTAVSSPVPATPPTISAAALIADTQATPRLDQGKVTGLTLQPKGGGDMFRAVGLQPGDVLRAVNGAAVSSADDAVRLQAEIAKGGALTLEVERGGRVVQVQPRVVP